MKKYYYYQGKVFYGDDCIQSKQCPYVRAAFSIATENEMDQGIKRFANILDIHYHDI